MAKHDVGSPAGSRMNALWGGGNRGGGQRDNALWGKGSRPLVTLAVASLALVLPLTALADSGRGPRRNTVATYVAPGLLQRASANPGEKMAVIIQSTRGTSDAENAVKNLGEGSLRKRLELIGAVAAEIPGGRLQHLAELPGLTITPDAVAKVSGLPTTKQLWPAETGNSKLWSGDAGLAGSMPTIAVVDSGIESTRLDFAGRLLASVNLSTLSGNSAGDGRGHGTFVAGIAAGSAAGYAGAAPFAKIVSIDVLDDRGVGRTSDIIAACKWILDNKGKYNIRVANFSLHSGAPGNFTTDPLNRAVQKLWFGGIVVVAAAGNYGVNGTPTRVKYAPGNDPFVITVGAVDIGGTAKEADDGSAPWSAYGYTYDGFFKPDVGAVGRFMVGPVPATSSLTVEKASNVTAPGYIQLSGTSFAAPIVAGAAAQILARHPEWTPSQVKGALMVTAKPLHRGNLRAAGSGEINAFTATKVVNPPNPNRALERFLIQDPAGGGLPVFDAAGWNAASFADASWDAASYADASFADASWDVASFADASWDVASYADASFADASYADASYADASYEDAAEGDASADSGAYVLSDEDLAVIMADPSLAPEDPSVFSATTALVSTPTASVGL